MSLDMAKYRRIFLEEGSDHLGEISHALFDLEKEMANGEAIDTLFRMAHSLKSMAASLGYDTIAELAHRMEDRMEGIRAGGRVRGHVELALLFRSLEMLEAMLAAVGNEQAPPDADEDLLRCLAEDPPSERASEDDDPDRIGGEPKKVRAKSLLLP